jgi:hypothetical protein
MLRRLLLVMSVAALMAAMVAVAAVPAFATIHPLANSECSNAKPGTQGFVSAELQDPPGLTPGPPDQSRAVVAQPIVSVFVAQGADSPAFKTSPDPNDPIQADCPAKNK